MTQVSLKTKSYCILLGFLNDARETIIKIDDVLMRAGFVFTLKFVLATRKRMRRA